MARNHPQAYADDADEDIEHHHEHAGQELEYNDLITTNDYASAYPQKNCCTWKVAALFLVGVATTLVLLWKALPMDDIIDPYIPAFPAPENPYTGPEAGSPADNGGITIGMPPSQSPGEDSQSDTSGTTVPSFMQCPEDGSLCCNGNTSNCKLPVNKMMFAMVHNAMSSEGECVHAYRNRL